jgi:hypothetical protein
MKLWDTTAVDTLAFWLPIIATLFAGIAGLIGCIRGDFIQGAFEIMAGLVSAAGIRATDRGSQIRDEKMSNLIIWNAQQDADRAS